MPRPQKASIVPELSTQPCEVCSCKKGASTVPIVAHLLEHRKRLFYERAFRQMNRASIETEVVRMGDVGTAIDMMDACIADMDGDKVERAVLILKEIFSSRYEGLRSCLYGGGGQDA